MRYYRENGVLFDYYQRPVLDPQTTFREARRSLRAARGSQIRIASGDCGELLAWHFSQSFGAGVGHPIAVYGPAIDAAVEVTLALYYSSGNYLTDCQGGVLL